jgi:hypothetical protein
MCKELEKFGLPFLSCRNPLATGCKHGADVNSSDFNPQTCKLLRRINSSLSGKWQIAPVVCSVPERINPSVGAYYFDTRVGMYLFFLSQIDFL